MLDTEEAMKQHHRTAGVRCHALAADGREFESGYRQLFDPVQRAATAVGLSVKLVNVALDTKNRNEKL